MAEYIRDSCGINMMMTVRVKATPEIMLKVLSDEVFQRLAGMPDNWADFIPIDIYHVIVSLDLALS